jgi:hypothetical protein
MLWRMFAEELSTDLNTPEARSQMEAMKFAATQARAEIAEAERTCLPRARCGPFGTRQDLLTGCPVECVSYEQRVRV